MLFRRCSNPIWVALSLIEGIPSPISLVGLWAPSVGKLYIRPVARRNALFRMRSISVSCWSVKTPRCVAWYLDLRSCSIAIVLRVGLRLRLARVLGRFFYVFSDVEEMFSEVEHWVYVYPKHFVGLIGW